MTEDERRTGLAEAFIAQARSDWTVHRHLSAQADFAVCHKLHYLQMACEKLAKAYRLRDTNSPVDELLKSHTGFDKFVAAFLSVALKSEYRNKDAQLKELLKRARSNAREIEKLAPAIDRVAAPENAEYPWERDEQVTAPCAYSFPSIELDRNAGGLAFLNLIERALADFERLAIT